MTDKLSLYKLTVLTGAHLTVSLWVLESWWLVMFMLTTRANWAAHFRLDSSSDVCRVICIQHV